MIIANEYLIMSYTVGGLDLPSPEKTRTALLQSANQQKKRRRRNKMKRTSSDLIISCDNCFLSALSVHSLLNIYCERSFPYFDTGILPHHSSTIHIPVRFIYPNQIILHLFSTCRCNDACTVLHGGNDSHCTCTASCACSSAWP